MPATKPKTRGLRLHVKLNPGAKGEEFIHSLEEAPGIRNVTQTFPGESDPELATLFLVEIDPAGVKSALQRLRRHPAVQYAEEVAPRKLIP